MLTLELLTDFSGGTNLRGQPLGVDKTDLLACSNMYPVASGYLIGRGGLVDYNPISLSSPAKSLYRFYKQNGTGITLATSDVYVLQGNDVVGAFVVIDSGYAPNQHFSFTTWSAKDQVYWINGIEPLKSFNGASVSTVGGSPLIGSQVELFQQRLYILTPNFVQFSDLDVDDTWQGAALLNISDNQGGVGSFLKAANQVLICGKTTGLWRLDGSPLLGSVLINYSSVGCIAPWTADVITVMSNGQVVPVGVIFLGKDGIYITDGYSVRLISQKIDPIFTGYFRDAVGKYYPKKRQYYLSFNPAGGPNNTTWVATNIDVSGERVAWSQYTGHSCNSYSVWDGGTDNGELLAAASDGGKVRKLDVGSQDVGNNYTCSFTTRYLGDPAVNKQVRWLKPTFDSTRAVHYQIDYFQKQFVSGPVSLDMPTTLIWNIGFWDVGTWAGTSFNSARTSIISGKYGRYLSMTVSNTGDGPGFRFFQLEVESRLKDRRLYDTFTLNQNA